MLWQAHTEVDTASLPFRARVCRIERMSVMCSRSDDGPWLLQGQLGTGSIKNKGKGEGAHTPDTLQPSACPAFQRTCATPCTLHPQCSNLTSPP